jgi:hypothetical protein
MAEDTEEYFLVSDSNEINSQLDSKKMSWDNLARLAESNLFKKHLGTLDKYLTNSQYGLYKSMLDETMNEIGLPSDLPDVNTWRGKFKAVDGQIIVLYKNDIPSNMAPVDYLKAHWDIPLDATIIQWKNCMLRGITYTTPNDNNNPIKRDSNQIVKLKEVNVPPHMHHSEVTSGSSVQSLCQVNSSTDSKAQDLSTRYDMFYNDSLDTGLAEDKNELDGIGDSFDVEETGSNEVSENSKPVLSHNNMPVMHNCYVFEIRFAGQ